MEKPRVCWRCGAETKGFASHIGPNGAWYKESCSDECADAWNQSEWRDELWVAYEAGWRGGVKHGKIPF